MALVRKHCTLRHRKRLPHGICLPSFIAEHRQNVGESGLWFLRWPWISNHCYLLGSWPIDPGNRDFFPVLSASMGRQTVTHVIPIAPWGTHPPKSTKKDEGFLYEERVNRIELSSPVWKTGTLPLSYTRIYHNHFLRPPWYVANEEGTLISTDAELPDGVGHRALWFLNVSVTINLFHTISFSTLSHHVNDLLLKLHCKNTAKFLNRQIFPLKNCNFNVS